MAKKFLVDIDLNKNQLQNVRLHNLTNPTVDIPQASASIGLLVMDTTSKVPTFNDGTKWVGLQPSLSLDFGNLVKIEAVTGDGFLTRNGSTWSMKNTFKLGTTDVNLIGTSTKSIAGMTSITSTNLVSTNTRVKDRLYFDESGKVFLQYDSTKNSIYAAKETPEGNIETVNFFATGEVSAHGHGTTTGGGTGEGGYQMLSDWALYDETLTKNWVVSAELLYGLRNTLGNDYTPKQLFTSTTVGLDTRIDDLRDDLDFIISNEDPTALDSIKELADLIGDNSDFAGSILSALANNQSAIDDLETSLESVFTNVTATSPIIADTSTVGQIKLSHKTYTERSISATGNTEVLSSIVVDAHGHVTNAAKKTISLAGLGYVAYTLPKATKSSLGGVIIGDRLSVDTNGKISANVQSDTNFTQAEKNKLAKIAAEANKYILPTNVTKIYTATLTTAASQTFLHGLNRSSVLVQVYSNTGELVECDVSVISTTSVKLDFNRALPIAGYKVVIVG